MDEELDPASLFSGDEVVAELPQVQSQWSKHPDQGQCSPLRMICHQQVEQERLDIGGDVQGWQEGVEEDKLSNAPHIGQNSETCLKRHFM